MSNKWLLICTILWCTASIADTGYLPEPPTFDIKTDPEEALATYPLGIINKDAAFSHHGEPDRKIHLSNGKEGWVYLIGYINDYKNYRMPSGEVKISEQTAWKRGLRGYTLVFDDGVVTDVIYKDDSSGSGLTSMELQHPSPKR